MLDRRFLTPMVASDSAGHIFVNDFVKYITGSGFKMAKIKTFFRKVSQLGYSTDYHNVLLLYGHRKMITFMFK